jgi:hypothetical protein
LLNAATKQKLQNIQHKTLRKACLRYEVVTAGQFFDSCNNVYCAIFICHLAAVGKVDLTNGWCWLGLGSVALSSYYWRLKQNVINYVNCVKS